MSINRVVISLNYKKATYTALTITLICVQITLGAVGGCSEDNVNTVPDLYMQLINNEDVFIITSQGLLQHREIDQMQHLTLI